MFNVRGIETKANNDQLMRTIQAWEEKANDQVKSKPFSKKSGILGYSYSSDAFSITLSLRDKTTASKIKVLVAYDKEKPEKIEAIAAYEEEGEYLSLKSILPNPQNRRSGAATVLARHLFVIALDQEKKGIRAQALPYSEWFYNKIGFERVSNTSSKKQGPMQITTAKIQEKISLC